MSGLPSGKAPRTDAEWAREVERRFKALENPTTIRLGEWVIQVVDGELVATAPGRSVALTAALAVDSTTSGVTRTTRTLTVVNATSGTFVMVYRNRPTTAVPYNASAATLQAALVALDPEAGTVDTQVIGDAGGPWTVILPPGTFSVDFSGLVGTDPRIVVT